MIGVKCEMLRVVFAPCMHENQDAYMRNQVREHSALRAE